MRYGIIIGIVVGAIGCGEVTSVDDGGTGTAGSSGVAGAGGALGTAGAVGGGGAGGAPPQPCDASCDLNCNTCDAGVCTPKVDGTSCGTPECGGPTITTVNTASTGAPVYTYPSIGYKHVCQAGACTKLVNVDCTGFTCTTCSSSSKGAPGCFTYDETTNETGTTQCRCVQTGTGGFCPL